MALDLPEADNTYTPEASNIPRNPGQEIAMRPRELVTRWVEAFNNANVEVLSALYAQDAVNHQVTQEPVEGREAIREMFRQEFAQAKMTCIVENLFEDGDWAILEWKDPLGLRGCGFFHIENDQILLQRGYWDKLSFFRQHNLPFPKA